MIATDCLKHTTAEPIWIFRKRYCNNCRTKPTTIVLIGDVRLSTPVGHFFRGPSPYPLPHATIPVSIVPGKPQDMNVVYKPNLEQFQTRFARLAADIERDTFVQEQRIITRRLSEQYNEVQAWYNRKREARNIELDNIRRTRFFAILEKLDKEGWGRTIDHLCGNDRSQLRSHPLQQFAIVRQPKPLTSRTWPKVYKEILPSLQRAEKQRLIAERKPVIQARLRTLEGIIQRLTVSHRFHFPGFSEIALRPDFVELIRAPSIVNVTEEIFFRWRRRLHRFPEIIASWETAQHERLSAHIRDAIDLPDDINPLDLAIGAYIILFPHTLRSAIAYSSQNYVPPPVNRINWDDPDQLPNFDTMPETAMLEVLNFPISKKIELGDPWLTRSIADMVKMCGLDPQATTAAQLDELDAKFTCDTCSIVGETRLVMSWRAAVLHAVQCHRKMKPSDPVETHHNPIGSGLYHPILEVSSEYIYRIWRPKATSTERLVIAAEANLKTEAISQQEISKIWHCAHCTDVMRLDAKRVVLEHIRSAHGIQQPGEEDYYAVPTLEDEWRPYRPIPLLPERRGRATMISLLKPRFQVLQ
ncbi:hypothetical protein K474DRAFT_1678819 [Panus rudis PR-1116 ss-1]|nr:hypothetical protein K474DRAFT_1678819 [Panus rudis PR-1116 ss-1]